MQSELEKFALQKLQRLRNFLHDRDRGVVFGTALAVIPIFPACTIGFIVSVFNVILLNSGKLPQKEKQFIIVGLVVGLFSSILWLYLIANVAGGVVDALNIIADRISALLGLQETGRSPKEVPGLEL